MSGRSGIEIRFLGSGAIWTVLYMLGKWRDKSVKLAITIERGSMKLMKIC